MAKAKKREDSPFASKNFTAENLQDELWSVLQKVKGKKISPGEANAVTMAAKEICNVARISLQYKLLQGPTQQSHPQIEDKDHE
jgi:hypothetical protein